MQRKQSPHYNKIKAKIKSTFLTSPKGRCWACCTHLKRLPDRQTLCFIDLVKSKIRVES